MIASESRNGTQVRFVKAVNGTKWCTFIMAVRPESFNPYDVYPVAIFIKIKYRAVIPRYFFVTPSAGLGCLSPYNAYGLCHIAYRRITSNNLDVVWIDSTDAGEDDI